MKVILSGLIVFLVLVGTSPVTVAEDLKDQVKVEKSYEGLHPGLDPGLYVCAGNHLHVKGTVRNRASVTLTSLTLEGKAYDADGKLLGTAHPPKIKPARLTPLKPGEEAEFDLEFLTITGQVIPRAKRVEIVVIEAKGAP